DAERLSFVTKAPLERLVSHGRPAAYLTGARICGGNQLSEAAYLILSGSCELRRNPANGPEEVLDTLGPGAAFGGLDRIQSDDACTTAVAIADSVVLSIPRENL